MSELPRSVGAGEPSPPPSPGGRGSQSGAQTKGGEANGHSVAPPRAVSDPAGSSAEQGPRDWLRQTAGAAAPSGGRELREASDRGGHIHRGGSSFSGCQTLFRKEVMRFWKVGFQTVGAPVLTAVLYMLIFGHVLQDKVLVYGTVSYSAFLVPGLVMMSVLQNAFANSSSSLIQSKIMGSLVFVLLSPLSHWHWFFAYVGSSVVRGLLVGVGVFAVTVFFGQPAFDAPLWIGVFAILGASLLGAMGVIAGLWSEKFDQMAAFQNFVIMPMTFLSGVFYSIHSLPPFWQQVSHLNPFFYMIDGFRYGFFGVSDVSPWLSLAIVSMALVFVSAIAVNMLRTGYKIRN